MCGIIFLARCQTIKDADQASSLDLSPSCSPLPSSAFRANESGTETVPPIVSLSDLFQHRGPDAINAVNVNDLCAFVSSTLSVRGTATAPEEAMPLVGPLGSVLAFNGELYAGALPLDDPALPDSRALLLQLDSPAISSPDHVAALLSSLRGPWALVLYHAPTRRIYFGRDPWGRRSLLYRLPHPSDDPSGGILSLSSIALDCGAGQELSGGSVGGAGEEEGGAADAGGASKPDYRELPPGIYSLELAESSSSSANSTSSDKQCLDFQTGLPTFVHSFLSAPSPPHHPLAWTLRRHDWTDSTALAISHAERVRSPSVTTPLPPSHPTMFQAALSLLDQAVQEQCRLISPSLKPSVLPDVPHPAQGQPEPDLPHAPVCVLFSGGLDSTLIAALASRHLDPSLPIDLLNVDFDNGASPDREGALDALEELTALHPSRLWRLVQIQATLQDVSLAQPRISALLAPRLTVMDLNIGSALWLAARNPGTLLCRRGGEAPSSLPGNGALYRSTARVCLLGHGADELFGGYSRFRTVYRNAGFEGLEAEMRSDIANLWLKNLGRDDRILSDTCRESRHPLLDERLVEWSLRQPVSSLCDLEQPLGTGDKQVLREALRSLGLVRTAARVKRAIQFGSRLGKKYNQLVYGSNRKANKASAGSDAATAIP